MSSLVGLVSVGGATLLVQNSDDKQMRNLCTSVAERCRTQGPFFFFLLSVLLKECATAAEDAHERRTVSNVYNNC